MNNTVVYSIYIKAPAQRVWDALTTSDYTSRWGYGGDVEIDLQPGGVYRNLSTDEMKQMGMGDVAVEGKVVEIDEPRRLVLDWAPAWHPGAEATRLTWELTEYPSGLTQVVLTHDVTNNPQLLAEVSGGADPQTGGGGWPWVLSDLKSLLETGRPMDELAG
ncbi:SRPBCC domain-containing protein [Tessaracoccus sp. G1721]